MLIIFTEAAAGPITAIVVIILVVIAVIAVAVIARSQGLLCFAGESGFITNNLLS